jgi:hypothetical protein
MIKYTLPIKLILYRIFNPILTAWAIKILSWEPPKESPKKKLNPIRDKVTNKLALPQITKQVLPPIEKPFYRQILNEHELAGKPIKPVKHRKPIPKDTICPICKAPYIFIYSNATIDSVKTKGEVQKFKCINPQCQYKLKHGFRYTYRQYSLSMDNITQFVPSCKGFSASHFSYASIAILLYLFSIVIKRSCKYSFRCLRSVRITSVYHKPGSY